MPSTKDTTKDKLMDTAPGGESTQYESIKTVTEPAPKQQGQLGSSGNAPPENPSVSSDSPGQSSTAKIRHGSNISELGMGGATTSSTGWASQEGGLGGTEARPEKLQQTRREQGYGGGSGVGA